jgi:hypothetical protein
MSMTSREAALGALADLLASAYDWATGPSRRLKLWSDVPMANRPACFIFEGGFETYSWSEGAIAKRVLEARVFIYLNAKDPTVIGASLLNDVMDALDSAFEISGQDMLIGRKTLGGLVYHCRIDGRPMKDPGDLDGDALLIVPVKLILP